MHFIMSDNYLLSRSMFQKDVSVTSTVQGRGTGWSLLIYYHPPVSLTLVRHPLININWGCPWGRWSDGLFTLTWIFNTEIWHYIDFMLSVRKGNSDWQLVLDGFLSVFSTMKSLTCCWRHLDLTDTECTKWFNDILPTVTHNVSRVGPIPTLWPGNPTQFDGLMKPAHELGSQEVPLFFTSQDCVDSIKICNIH